MKHLGAVLVVLLGTYSATLFAHPAVSDAWVRLLPPNVKTTSAYVNFASDHDDKIVAIRSEIAEKVEMHESSMENGMMTMRPLESLSISSEEGLSLQPQGKHLMLMGLKRALIEGESIKLFFEFEQSGTLMYRFEVRKP
jgi:copper(I)-binding protein